MGEAHTTLIGAVTRALEGSGLQVTRSGSELTIIDPGEPEEGSFIVDYKDRYLAWEHLTHDYWHFEDLTDDQVVVFIAGKLRGIRGERVRRPVLRFRPVLLISSLTGCRLCRRWLGVP